MRTTGMKIKILTLLTAVLVLAACYEGTNGSEVVTPIVPAASPEQETQEPESIEPEPPQSTQETTVEVYPIQWGEHALQWGELYLPSLIEGPLTPIVMIHGGCWRSSYILTLQSDLSAALARLGYAVWNIEYRSLGGGGEWPVMFQDVAKAADYLKQLSSTYPLNLDKAVAMGHSAGGHLALWLAGRETIAPDQELYSQNTVPMSGAIALGGIADLLSSACGSAPGMIINRASLGGDALQERLKITSPIHMLPIAKPTTLISGARDAIVPSSLSEAYTLAALAVGDRSEHIVIDSADHFYLIDPNSLDLAIIDQAIAMMVGE